MTFRQTMLGTYLQLRKLCMYISGGHGQIAAIER